MRTVDPFVRAALIGLGRDVGTAVETNTPVDVLVETRDERGFLLRAGARDLYIRAGYKPPRTAEAFDAAPADTLPSCSPPLAALLSEVVMDGDAEVLHTALSELAAAHLQLPHALLPNVLALQDRRLRAAALPVIGERGRWLARQSSAWSWAAGADASVVATVWEEGNEEQQVLALRALRAADPGDARTKLAERLPKERAEQRALLLGALEFGLSAADEELVERMLDDRSAGVKLVAADLLARLPSSAFVSRMQTRLEAVAGVGRKFAIEPPVELDAAAARDISVKTMQGSARAMALVQIIGAVPLSWWTSRYDLEPEQLVKATRTNDWYASIIEGWALAAVRQRNGEWASLLVNAAVRGDITLESGPKSVLARVLPVDDLTALLLALNVTDETWPLAALLAAVPRPWPHAFAYEWLARTRSGAVSSDVRESLALAATAELVARSLPPHLFDAATQEWTITDESWLQGEWRRRLGKLQQIIRIRKTIAEERES